MRGIKHVRLALISACWLQFSGSVSAVPVKPDLGKILRKQEQRSRQFEPAQAGWNGPEMQRPQDAAPNPVLEAYGPAATARSIRAALSAAAIPDPKAVIAITVVIVLMRMMRQVRDKRGKREAGAPISTVPVQRGRNAA